MEMIPLDGFPAGLTATVQPAGNASPAETGDSPFASLLAEAAGSDESKGDVDGSDPEATAAALMALLFPQNPALQQAAALANGETPAAVGAIAATDTQANASGKQQGLAEGQAGTAEIGDNPLPNLKQDRGETPAASTGLTKTVALNVGETTTPPSPPIPPALLGSEGDASEIKPTASKATDLMPTLAPKAAEPAAIEAPKPADAKPTDATKPAAQIPADNHLAAANTQDDLPPAQSQDSDASAPQSPATGLAERPAGTVSTATPHAAVERLAALIQRPDLLAAHVQRAYANGRDRISIALLPAELGRIEISLDFDRSGKLSALIAADRPQTLDLLQRDQRGLERALQEAGFKTDSGSLSFNLRGDQRHQQNQPLPWPTMPDRPDPWLAADRRPSPLPAFSRSVADGRLDIEV